MPLLTDRERDDEEQLAWIRAYNAKKKVREKRKAKTRAKRIRRKLEIIQGLPFHLPIIYVVEYGPYGPSKLRRYLSRKKAMGYAFLHHCGLYYFHGFEMKMNQTAFDDALGQSLKRLEERSRKEGDA